MSAQLQAHLNTNDFFFKKGMSQTLEAVLKIRQDADAAMDDLRAECGLGETANMKQCLRVLLQRISASPQVNSLAIQNEHGVSAHWQHHHLPCHHHYHHTMMMMPTTTTVAAVIVPTATIAAATTNYKSTDITNFGSGWGNACSLNGFWKSYRIDFFMSFMRTHSIMIL
jgi:hypothetical protein